MLWLDMLSKRTVFAVAGAAERKPGGFCLLDLL